MPNLQRILEKYRRWKFRLKQRVQAGWRFPIKVVFLMLMATTFLLYLATVNRVEIAAQIPDARLIGTKENLEAILITLWGSVAFFLLIGIASVFVGLHEPRDDIIESRLLYLFSSNKVSPGAMEHNKAAVTKLSAFCTSSETEFFIEEINEEFDCFKVEVNSKQVLQNGFHNHPHVDDDVHLTVYADPVEEIDVVGEIKSIMLMKSLDFGPEWRLPERVSLTSDDPVFANPIPMQIDANGSLHFSYQYWIWCNNSKGYSFGTSRFCENASATLTNRTDRQICLDFRVDDRQIRNLTLKAGQSCELVSNTVFTPDTPWRFYISPVLDKPREA